MVQLLVEHRPFAGLQCDCRKVEAGVVAGLDKFALKSILENDERFTRHVEVIAILDADLLIDST